ncbi:transcriptional regulator with XRE-family HTH domain [Micromonospora pisi]|uniref:Transcriptional regulator with XRE-family HTH domain n=1 Tax=Micromonospora pisi TaxID=589240 RepID=A0A495JEB6_9ACTN|nr:helix-turn-helix transcriptional regulator [Micromonospora pisi]RKR87346.1 transcriptional regulator with XRE-family HTH domain [Micromonospora pisi]
MSTDTIGARIKYWRLRRGGMTQTVLAGLAGVTQPYISQVEAGRKTIERRATLIGIAAALQVTVADLLDQPGDPTDPIKAGAADAVPAIWSALIEIEEGERRAPTWTAEQLGAEIARNADLRDQANHAAMARALPALLLAAAGHDDGGRALAQVGYQASACLRHLGYRHLARVAAKVALAAAESSGHTAWIGAARFATVQSLPIEAAGVAGRVAGRALADLQNAAAAPDVRQMLGQLHLSAAFASAVDGRADDASGHLAEAAREAATLGDPVDGAGFNQACFGPTNVKLWEMSIAAELGEHGRVAEVAREVQPGPLRAVIRHQSYWLDLGRALAHSGRSDREALTAFMRAERAAPMTFTLNPLAHDAVVAMVRRARDRSMSDDLRILARRVGADVQA